MKNDSPSNGENGQLVQSQGLVHSIPQNINISNFSYPFDFFLQAQAILQNAFSKIKSNSNTISHHSKRVVIERPFHVSRCMGTRATAHNKVFRKVRQRRHRNPVFGHIGGEISKNRNKKYTNLQRGMKLRPGLHQCPGPI